MCFQVKRVTQKLSRWGEPGTLGGNNFNDMLHFAHIFSIKAAEAVRTDHIYCLHLPATKIRYASEALCLGALRELALAESTLVRDHCLCSDGLQWWHQGVD
jgi:hypothetical protein